MTTGKNWLARERAIKKRRRERLLAAAHEKVERYREGDPLPQAQLPLEDPYLSKREHELRVMRQLQLEQANERAARTEAVHAAAAGKPHYPPQISSARAARRGGLSHDARP